MNEIISEISYLCDKYGDDFDWGIVSSENRFVDEFRIL